MKTTGKDIKARPDERELENFPILGIFFGQHDTEKRLYS